MKTKMKLDELKVRSFTTNFTQSEIETIKSGWTTAIPVVVAVSYSVTLGLATYKITGG